MDSPVPAAGSSSSTTPQNANQSNDDDDEDGDSEALAAHIAKMGGKLGDAGVQEARSVKCSDVSVVLVTEVVGKARVLTGILIVVLARWIWNVLDTAIHLNTWTMITVR